MLYARSDVSSVTVPVQSGGCGATHSRVVTRGAPAKVFAIDCPDHCEPYLRGDRRPKKLVYQIDKATGQALRQERVADADPMFSSTPDTIPLTPDEERTNATRTERGRMQIEMIQALAAIRATGLQVPAEAMFLLEREIPEGVLKGTVLCANQHDNAAGVKYCGECGISMNAQASIDPASDSTPAIPLDTLHVATLRKMCRERNAPDSGNKAALISRIMAA